MALPGWPSTARPCSAIALELAKDGDRVLHSAYEDMASKFFEHFVQISRRDEFTLGGTGLWDEAARLLLRSDPDSNRRVIPLKTRIRRWFAAADRGRGAGGTGHYGAARIF